MTKVVEFGMCSSFYILFIVFELLPILKDKDKKLFYTYGIIAMSTYIAHVMLIVGIKIPSPADPIKNLIISIFNLKL